MKGAHMDGFQKCLNDTEKHQGYKNTDRHPGHTCSKKIAGCRCKAEPAVLKHHAVGKAEPDVYGQIHIININ